MFEEYMQNILGYTRELNTYNRQNNMEYGMNQNINMMPIGYNISQDINRNLNDELEGMYPEIYSIVYPMVKEACMRNTRSIDKNLINEMTNEIYDNLEPTNNSVGININLGNEIRSKEESKISKEKSGEIKNREYERRNPFLNDLIKILILRELTGRPGCCTTNRPPMPPPPRPPFPRF